MSNQHIALGRTFLTSSVDQLCSADKTFAAFVTECLDRHEQGDWRDLDPSDREANRRAIADGDARVLSTYPVVSRNREPRSAGRPESHLWVITDPGPTTTVLWPSDC